MVCRKALSFTNELSFLFFIFCQYAALSSRAVDGHQMYSGGSVVRKTSTIDPEISLSPTLVFTGGGQKCEIWRRFQHHSRIAQL